MISTQTSRRALLNGVSGVTVAVSGGVVWRVWGNGVFIPAPGRLMSHGTTGAAPNWTGRWPWFRPGSSPLTRTTRSRGAFYIGENRIAVFADHARHIGAFDPYRREMALSLGCAIDDVVGPPGHKAFSRGSSWRRIASHRADRNIASAPYSSIATMSPSMRRGFRRSSTPRPRFCPRRPRNRPIGSGSTRPAWSMLAPRRFWALSPSPTSTISR